MVQIYGRELLGDGMVGEGVLGEFLNLALLFFFVAAYAFICVCLRESCLIFDLTRISKLASLGLVVAIAAKFGVLGWAVGHILSSGPAACFLLVGTSLVIWFIFQFVDVLEKQRRLYGQDVRELRKLMSAMRGGEGRSR